MAMLMPPPTPLVPLPTVMDTSPARPAVAAPVPTMIEPVLPPCDVPDEKISMPLTPVVPEFAVRIVIMPLDVDVPSPVEIPRAPPVCGRDRPVAMWMAPPTPLSPLPTVMDSKPPRPELAAPVPTRIDPVLPVLDVPDEKISIPLTPASPELAVRIVMMPLDVAVPSPVDMPRAPPVRG